MSKMTREEIKEWNELCNYIKLEILRYDNTMKFPRHMALRLKGLKDGKFIANKNIENQGSYTFNEILLVFKANKIHLDNCVKEEKFKDENHKINYIMTIVENKINTIVLRYRNILREKEMAENIELNNINEDKANYSKKTKKITNSRLKGLI